MAKKGGAKKGDKGGKKQKSQKKPTQLWKLYTVEGEKVVRKNPFSPKSPGDFMAVHKDRVVCGKTGYTEFRKSEKKE